MPNKQHSAPSAGWRIGHRPIHAPTVRWRAQNAMAPQHTATRVALASPPVAIACSLSPGHCPTSQEAGCAAGWGFHCLLGTWAAWGPSGCSKGAHVAPKQLSPTKVIICGAPAASRALTALALLAAGPWRRCGPANRRSQLRVSCRNHRPPATPPTCTAAAAAACSTSSGPRGCKRPQRQLPCN